MSDLSQNSMVTSSERWRINSTAAKITEAFDSARAEARDEALWLSDMCRRLLQDNDHLRVQIDALTKRIEAREYKRDPGDQHEHS